MGLNTIILFIVFITLVSCRLLREESSILSFSRTKQEWTIDLMGLFIQGVVIPIFPLLLIPFLEYCFPHYNKRIEINPWNQVLLSFVLIDYLYYWNHRLFHTKRFWHIHRLHHSSKHLDVFGLYIETLYHDIEATSFVTELIFCVRQFFPLICFLKALIKNGWVNKN